MRKATNGSSLALAGTHEGEWARLEVSLDWYPIRSTSQRRAECVSHLTGPRHLSDGL